MSKLLYNDDWYTIKELSEMSGIKEPTLRDRLRRGYPVHIAVKPIPMYESVEDFCESSCYEDWIGMSISDLYTIYWNWCVSHEYHPTSKQGFSRQIMLVYPMLKIVPIKIKGKCHRLIRVRK